MPLAASKLTALRAARAKFSHVAPRVRVAVMLGCVMLVSLTSITLGDAAAHGTVAPRPATRSGGATRVDSAAARTTPPSAAAPDVATLDLKGASASSPGGPDYIARVRAAFTPENRRYARVRQGLAIAEPFWELIFALLLLFTGMSARLRDAGRRVFRRRYGRVLVYLAMAGLAAFVFRLPVTAFRDYWWEHRFGLSNQSAPAWFVDELKALALDLMFLGGTGLIALALWGVEIAGRRWWLWLACGTLPVAVAAVLLQPLVFEPAFNRFEPLHNARLGGRILALAARAGIPARRVFQVDRSRQTRTVNAYVSGFGPSQRIVLWDTTLEQLSEDEILFVMGHEMGHYKLHHLWQGVVLAWLLSFALLFAGARIMDRALRRFGPRWGVTSLADEAALPLFAAVLGLLLTLAQPAVNAWSRRIEHQADAFGLEATRMNDAAARTFVKFGVMNRSDPDPPAALKLLLYTHPPLVDRVRFALAYRPWEQNQPNRYFRGQPATNAAEGRRAADRVEAWTSRGAASESRRGAP